MSLWNVYVTEGMDSSATDSGTEDVLSSQPFAGRAQKRFSTDHEERQPRQYKNRKLDTEDSDWLTKRSGTEPRSPRQHKVINICLENIIC